MEKKDEKLIATLVEKDPELKELMENHLKLGERVDELSKRSYLTTE